MVVGAGGWRVTALSGAGWFPVSATLLVLRVARAQASGACPFDPEPQLSTGTRHRVGRSLRRAVVHPGFLSTFGRATGEEFREVMSRV